MQIIEIPKNLLINNIFVDSNDTEKHTHFLHKNDSYIYFNSIKNKLIEKEYLKNKVENYNKDFFFPYATLISKYNKKCNFTSYDLELLEILNETNWFNANAIYNKLFILNISSSSFFKSEYFSQRRHVDDFIENCNISTNNLSELFDKIQLHFKKKEIINLFNFDISHLCISKERNYLLFYIIKCIAIYSSTGAWLVIKMNEFANDLFLQEFLYLISGWYSVSYIVNSSLSINQNNNYFLVCKNFKLNNNIKLSMINQFNSLNNICKEKEFFPWNHLLADRISKVFINCLKEIRMIIGQIELEYLEVIISLLKNKSKHEKINLFIENNLTKCDFWEQKYISINHIITDNNINENFFVSGI